MEKSEEACVFIIHMKTYAWVIFTECYHHTSCSTAGLTGPLVPDLAAPAVATPLVWGQLFYIAQTKSKAQK